VSPVFKTGSKRKTENYRPISLTSQLCEVFESIIRDEIVTHPERNLLINESQHGLGREIMSQQAACLIGQSNTVCG